MNRPAGQPQRPPNLTPQSSTVGAGQTYRPQYPYGTIPPRNVNVAGVLQTGAFGAGNGGSLAPNRTPQPTFLQQRGGQQPQTATGFAFQSLQSDVGLDPNDFPALGSANANNNSANSTTTSSNGGASYASQAGLGPSSSTTTNTPGTTTQPRDFGPDDFPALGGQSSTSQQSQSTTDNSNSHPPGLNGFEHRQNLLGTITGSLQPGMISLPAPGAFADDKQRRNNFIKPGATAAWTSQQQQQQQQSQQNGVPFNPNGLPDPQHPPPDPSPNAAPPPNSLPPPPSTSHHPQTPAQQILVSPADKWGLLGLLAILKAASTTDLDGGLTSLGTDLGTMGLDLAYPSSLSTTFITPWADQSAAHQIEPNWTVPSCYYDVRPPVPGPSKLEAFSDETLFFVFYSAPRDALQEIAAQELYNRTWRYHKSLRIWISKEGAQLIKHLSAPTGAGQTIGEVGYYTYWDVDNWTRERKEMTVVYSELEERTAGGVFPPAQTLEQSKQMLAASLGASGTGAAAAAQQTSRGTYQISM